MTFFCIVRAKFQFMFLRLSICLSFNSCGTHLPTFWIFPISRRWLETACWWLTLNCSASCFCESSSSSNACNSTSSYFLVCRVPSATSKSPILKRWNHSHVFCDGACGHKLLQVIGMIPQQFSSNENKKLMLSANAPYLVQISYETQQHNTMQTLFNQITLRVWHLLMYNKMAYNVKSLYFTLH